MEEELFGFIGTGNMGGALARAAVRGVGGGRVLLANRTREKAEALARETGASTAENADVAARCRYIFLGVKPQGMAALLAELAPVLGARQDEFVLVTMAAGLRIADIRRMAGVECPVVRIMPNTPAAVGEGVILFAVPDEPSGAAAEKLTGALASAGRFDRLPEELIDAGSAVSGCGPAFVYLFAEALADGGVECGLPRQKALLYAAQTLRGASSLLLETARHPGELKDAVCSPGGTTIAGVHALEKSAFRAAVMDAVTAAFQKTKDLAK